MITIFNRKELTITNSIERQSEIRELLSGHNIDYKIRFIQRHSSAGGRARTEVLTRNSAITNQYIFYVRKSDLENARFVLIDGHIIK